MEHTKISEPADWVGQPNLGFAINAAFSSENSGVLSDWLTGLQSVAPEGVYIMPPQALHITVLDWVAPLFDYQGADKRTLFESLRPSYDAAFERITSQMKPFEVKFSELRVTPGTIILIGQDDGQFAALRKEFTDTVPLPDGAKQPPTIIHSSLARFIAPVIPLDAVEEFARTHPVELTQRIEGFRLIETRREPMQDFSVLKNYPLAG